MRAVLHLPAVMNADYEDTHFLRAPWLGSPIMRGVVTEKPDARLLSHDAESSHIAVTSN